MTCQARTASFDLARRLTRDGSDGGTLPYFSPQGVPVVSYSVSLRTPSWQKRRVWTDSRQDAAEDMLVESVVLAHLITERPQGMTILMLSLHFNAEFDQGVEGSAVERAVRELVRDGQLRMEGGRVVPGRPGGNGVRRTGKGERLPSRLG
jgi:hypothetical protein